MARSMPTVRELSFDKRGISRSWKTQITDTSSFEYSHHSNIETEFRILAKTAGWPSELVEQISISSNIEFEYPDEVAEEIEDLEYGVPGGAPNSVMRPFLARYKKNIQQNQEEEILDMAIPKGVL